MKKYYCNKCGKELDVFDMQSGLRMHSILGYGSKYDEETINLDLCCNCTDELIDYIKSIGKMDPIATAEDPVTDPSLFENDDNITFIGKLAQV